MDTALGRLELDLLASLAVLLEERSVTRAAVRLHLSQPAVSQQLARLRDLFGDPLLVVSGRGMVLTPRATALAPELTRLIGELRGLVEQRRSFDPVHATGTFRVIAGDYLHTLVTIPLIARLARVAPGIRVAALIQAPPAGAQLLRDGGAEVMIAPDFLLPDDLRSRPLYRSHFVFAQRRGHPRGPAPPTLEEYCQLDHLLITTGGGGFRGSLDAALTALGLERRVMASAPSFLLASALLTRTDLVAALPRQFAASCGDALETMPLPLKLEGFTVTLAWHDRTHLGAAERWLRDNIAEATSEGRN